MMNILFQRTMPLRNKYYCINLYTLFSPHNGLNNGVHLTISRSMVDGEISSNKEYCFESNFLWKNVL